MRCLNNAMQIWMLTSSAACGFSPIEASAKASFCANNDELTTCRRATRRHFNFAPIRKLAANGRNSRDSKFQRKRVWVVIFLCAKQQKLKRNARAYDAQFWQVLAGKCKKVLFSQLTQVDETKIVCQLTTELRTFQTHFLCAARYPNIRITTVSLAALFSLMEQTTRNDETDWKTLFLFF